MKKRLLHIGLIRQRYLISETERFKIEDLIAMVHFNKRLYLQSDWRVA